nr:hypothetical protein GCM10020063_033450 [Dactylosporangium thailandense]
MYRQYIAGGRRPSYRRAMDNRAEVREFLTSRPCPDQPAAGRPTRRWATPRARAAPQRGRSPRRAKPTTIRPSLQWSLDAITAAPAIIGNGRMDLLAANRTLTRCAFDHCAFAHFP